MSFTIEGLRAAALVLELIERRREETGWPEIGSAVEQSILTRFIGDLENGLTDAHPNGQSA